MVVRHHAPSRVLAPVGERSRFRLYLAASNERISHRFGHLHKTCHRVSTSRCALREGRDADHLSNRRFEFGTGRGAGSHEVATFNIHDPSSTKSEYYECFPRSCAVGAEDYTFRASTSSRHAARQPAQPTFKVIPRSGGRSVALAHGRSGGARIGALGFTFLVDKDMGPLLDSYKQPSPDARIRRSVQERQRDDHVGCACSLDRRQGAPQQATQPDYIITLVTLYHDTFPRNPLAARWPTRRVALARSLDEMCNSARPRRYARGDLRTAPALRQAASTTRLRCAQRCQPRGGPRDDRYLRQVS